MCIFLTLYSTTLAILNPEEQVLDFIISLIYQIRLSIMSDIIKSFTNNYVTHQENRFYRSSTPRGYFA